MILLLDVKTNDLDGNLTLDGPKTLKNAKLISNKASVAAAKKPLF
jgi:hypothetical protein